MRRLLALFLVLILFSCTQRNPSKNYYYLSEYDALDVGYPYGSIVYKSTKEYHYQKVVVFSDVLMYKSDSRYILMEQRPNRKLMDKNIKDDLSFWSNYYVENKKDTVINVFGDKMSIKHINNLLTTLSEDNLQRVSDSIVKNNASLKSIFKNKLNYYLIDKKSDSLYGPMNKDELSKIRARKGVTITWP
ncbi:hypothetical protein [Pedobacter heparinus]|uniref:Lipoprotein n=1 Tax=Pedobacter heparinus (strain ATCC 13125 / DSM 2366 / CIP 104194 / JCM 7457 / NBRC 12017 / NCIMB 9290 / NRRL B-14731 / HIM 762-3) TaxID=485917 RepID=C6XU64_PEDHD|nr:hypothetical protein [Pedobacter heparinus]ACU05857.1 hypothetical protein Phep_3666 [Pedobacter heparinus DSM 2366]